MQRFEGRTALITGAGGGTGRATAARLAGEGAAVVCADVDETRLPALMRVRASRLLESMPGWREVGAAA